MALCLTDFDALYAPLIASWVRGSRELLWLAPRTQPPLTAAKVMAWGREREHRFLLWDAISGAPVGYSELNEMPGERDSYWIGHFLVDPSRRGRGVGRKFVHALLCQAFEEWNAREVSLVVFPENSPAIRCYELNGMEAMGREFKYFKESRQRHEFLRMAIRKKRFRQLMESGELPVRTIQYVADASTLRAKSNPPQSS